MSVPFNIKDVVIKETSGDQVCIRTYCDGKIRRPGFSFIKIKLHLSCCIWIKRKYKNDDNNQMSSKTSVETISL